MEHYAVTANGFVESEVLAVLSENDPVIIAGEQIPYPYLQRWEKTAPEELFRRYIVRIQEYAPPEADIVIPRPCAVGDLKAAHGYYSRNFTIAEREAYRIEACQRLKARVQNHILDFASAWKQRNMLAHDFALLYKKIDNIPLSKDENTEQTENKVIWDRIRHLRTRSDEIEAAIAQTETRIAIDALVTVLDPL